MNQELSMSPNLLVAALQKPASEFTKSRHRFLYKGEWNHYGELHVSCCRRAVENFELCH